ncbi:MAG: DUF1295 domain-containing protein [Chrysiogenales bacterium]|nr:MAG: DUF1295 domain-containing protein [Chrysiogenales bacterium]
MRQGHPGGGKDSGHHDGEVNRKGGRAPLTKALRLLYLPYKWLIFVPLFVLSTCFFVGIGIVIIFIFNDRTAGVWWARFNSFITPMIMTVISSEERGLSWIDGTGIAVWCVGFIFEFMGDFQLDQFIKNPTNRGENHPLRPLAVQPPSELLRRSTPLVGHGHHRPLLALGLGRAHRAPGHHHDDSLRFRRSDDRANDGGCDWMGGVQEKHERLLPLVPENTTFPGLTPAGRVGLSGRAAVQPRWHARSRIFSRRPYLLGLRPRG